MKMKRVLPVIVLFAVLAGIVLTCALCGVFSIKSEAAEQPTFDAQYSGSAGATQVIDGVTYTFVTDATTLKNNLENGTNCILGGNITLTAAQTPLVLKNGVALYGNRYALEVTSGVLSGAMFTANGKATVTNLLVGKTTAVKTDSGLFTTASGTDLTLKKTAAYFNQHTVNQHRVTPVAGGYFGMLYGKVTMEDCYANGSVGNKNMKWFTGVSDIGLGGFVGQVNSNAELSMTRCYNNAYLYADDPAVAGLIGTSKSATVTIDNCANQADTFQNTYITQTARDQANLISRIYSGTITVKNCTNTINLIDRGGRQGGFIGQVGVNTTVTFENCTNKGAVSARAAKAGYGDYAGGFVGVCNDNVNLTFTDCRNEGNVVLHGISILTQKEVDLNGGVTGGDDHAVGGFVGLAASKSGTGTPHLTFTDCVNTGTVADYTCLREVAAEIADKAANGYGTPTVTIYVGGFVGYARSSNQVTFDSCTNKGTVDGTGYAKSNAGTSILVASGTTATVPDDLNTVKNVGGFIGHTWTSANLKFQNGTYNEGTVKGYSHLGGLVGAADSPVTVTDSGNKGAVTGVHSEIGGIAGVFSSISVTCTNAVNTGTVTGGKTVGGFAGSPEVENPEAPTGKTLTLTGFVNEGAVTGTTQVGGILGAVDDNYVKLVLDACENRGSITATAANGTAGGLVGENTAAQGTVTWTSGSATYTLDTSFTVQNCLNTGAVTVTNTSGYPGGIIGKVGAGVTVTGTTNTGAVTGYYAAGGFFAIVDNAGAAQKVQITNSSNTGKITATNTAGNTYAGGLVGRAFNNINLEICDSVNSGEVSAEQEEASPQVCAGGLVGHVYSGTDTDTAGTVLLHGSVNLGKITATQAGITSDKNKNNGAGGIVGGIDHGSANVGNQISHCRNYGTVSSNEKRVGGIVGGVFWNSHVTVTQCTNYGILKTDTLMVGGMVGNVRAGTVNMTYCTNLGDIQSVEGNAAGMVGEFQGHGKIENCLSAGKITVTTTGTANAVGGIVGYSGSLNYDISGCVSIANIKLSANKRTGGIVGGPDVKSVTNCYSFGVIEGVASADEYGYLIGKSGANTSNTYSGNYYLTGVIKAENAQTIGSPTAMSISEAMAFLKTYCKGFTDFGVDGGLQFINENDTVIKVATPFLRGAQQKTETDGTKTVRLLTTVDSLQYQRVGFEVTLENGTASPSTKHIYAEQYANQTTFTAAGLFGDYLYVLDMEDVPAAGTATFTVKPYAVWNGQTVYGQAYKLTYRDGVLESFEAVW